MIDLKKYSIFELKKMRHSITQELKERYIEERVANAKNKIERREVFSGAVEKGFKILFLYNHKERIGIVERQNHKTVTAIFDGKTRYIKYENIIKIISKNVDEKI